MDSLTDIFSPEDLDDSEMEDTSFEHDAYDLAPLTMDRHEHVQTTNTTDTDRPRTGKTRIPPPGVSPEPNTKLVLEQRLAEAFAGLKFSCTHCRAISDVVPPFDLEHFTCAECGVESHPFVQQGGQTLDLRYLRELMVACYHRKNVARGVLVQSARRGRRGRPWDAQIKPSVVVAHALAAYIHHRRIHITTASFLCSMFLPFVHIFAHFIYREDLKDQASAWIKTGPCSLRRFDPRRLFSPAILEAIRTKHIAWPDLDAQGVGSRAYPVDTWSRYLDGIGEPAAAWNISIDRSKTLDETIQSPVPLLEQDFAAKVAEASAATLERDSTLTARARRVLLYRQNLSDLPFSQLKLLDREDFPEPFWSDEQCRAVLKRKTVRTLDVHPLYCIESCDHRTGIVYNTCISVSSIASLTSVRWRLFCWGPSDAGIRDEKGHLDASERKLCSAEIRASDVDLRTILCVACGFAYIALWIWLTATTATPVFDYLLFCAYSFVSAVGMSILAEYHLGNTLPRELRDPKQHKRMAAEAIEASWRQLDRSPTRGVTGTFGPASVHEGILADEVDFALHAHNEAVLAAILVRAEAMGIDMKEFKEHVFELNNFGVIASEIHGPVAAGTNARAEAVPTKRRGNHARTKKQP